ncbi:MAG: MMPL family transporter, partial [Chloroflexi bacterium]|nr:MMPL family transporter [Chloroflexota bacterium]
MFERIGVLAYRLRYLIVIVWVIAAVLSVKFAPSLASAGAADQASFLPDYAPSVQAVDALDKAFPGAAASSSATLTFSRDDGLTDADRAYLERVATWTTSADAPQELRDAVLSVDSAASRPELASMLRSSDGVLELLTVNLNVGSAGGLADTIVTQLRDHLASTAPAGLAVHVTGAAGITTDYIRAIQAGTDSTTLVTIVLVVIILLLIYRAPLAALVPLLTIGAAFVLARGVLGVLAAAGWQVSSLLDTFLVVLVFGVGTDYAIFLISRYREEVGHEDWHEAVRETVKRIGAVISASAATVIVGLAAMAFADFEMIRTTGPALGVAVFITLIAGLTLAPALLGIFGHYLFWPLHMRTAGEGEPDGFFARLAAGVSRHPGVVTLALVIGLAIPILYVPQARTNFDTLAELPATSDARAGYDIVAAHLGKGRITQSTGLIDAGATGDMLAPASLAKLRDTVLALEATPGVDTVTSLVTPDGDGTVPDGFRPSVQLGTIADELDPDGAGTSTDFASLLDSEVSDGLSAALDYVNALGTAFPDVAGRSEHRTATRAIADAQAVVDRVRAQSVVSTQLRALASAMTSTSSLASSGGSSDTTLLARYLDELAAAFPEVRGLAAFTDATAAAASLAKSATLDAAVAASNALQALAVHFDAQPDARLSPASLADTASAREARRRAEATFAALPDAFRNLAAIFAGRSDDIFVPVGIGGDQSTSLSDAVEAFVSPDGTATRLYIATTDDPYSITAFKTVRAAREALADAAPSFGQGATVHLGGSTAQLTDVQDVLAADFLRVGAITVLGILIVLVVLLRAIVAPLYLVGTVLLSYGSALGLSAFLFQEVLGQPGISFYLPLMVFVLLVALGADYNIFLMSRVREESE